jgi:cobalt/nickel transport system permease protein
MRDQIAFAIYLVAVIAITFVHEIPFLLAGTGIIALLGGRNFWKVARRAAMAILLFNSIVTVSYGVVSLLQENFSVYYVALINLRVFLLTSLTFTVRERIDPLRLLGFSRSLSSLYVIAYGQAHSLLRLLEEFRLALRSRSTVRPSLGILYRHSASIVTSLLEKSVRDASEITQAMKSRGFFHD